MCQKMKAHQVHAVTEGIKYWALFSEDFTRIKIACATILCIKKRGADDGKIYNISLWIGSLITYVTIIKKYDDQRGLILFICVGGCEIKSFITSRMEGVKAQVYSLTQMCVSAGPNFTPS